MPGLVTLPNAARALSLPTRPGGPLTAGRARIPCPRGSAGRASRPEMAPQRIEKIRFAPGNGMASEGSTPTYGMGWESRGISPAGPVEPPGRFVDVPRKLQNLSPKALKTLARRQIRAPLAKGEVTPTRIVPGGLLVTS